LSLIDALLRRVNVEASDADVRELLTEFGIDGLETCFQQPIQTGLIHGRKPFMGAIQNDKNARALVAGGSALSGVRHALTRAIPLARDLTDDEFGQRLLTARDFGKEVEREAV
jgi:hypothetical protein